MKDSRVKDGDTIVVWFSCGAASAVAAKKTIEIYGKTNTVKVVNSFILEEDEDNVRFLKDVEKWLNVTIEQAINPKYPSCSCVDVWSARKYMSGTKGAPCTKILKKEARYEWERNNHYNFLVMGYTVDEPKRYADFIVTERENTINVLGSLGLSKEDCFEIIDSAGIVLPLSYLLGFPNANCIGCVKATSPTYWNHVRLHYPSVFEERAKQSRLIGCRLTRYNKKRLFLDELPADAKGRKMKSLKMPDCGIFCNEKL